MKLSKKIFYLIVFLLPVNLGKHFIISDSYVDGLLVDYLIPTLYLQEILILILVLSWFIEFYIIEKRKITELKNFIIHQDLVMYYYFIFSLFLSILISPVFNLSLVLFFRIFLYFLFFIYIKHTFNFKNEFSKFSNSLLLGFLSVSFLGLMQFYKQGSVFNNYYVFGEQPYSFSTNDIRLENPFGYTMVPSYGLFSHPNVFGGLLSIVLLIAFSQLSLKERKRSLKIIFYIAIMGGALLCTISYFSIFSFLLGLLLYLCLTKIKRNSHQLIVYLVFFIIVFSVSFPLLRNYFPNYFSNISVYRRSELLISSYKMFSQTSPFGVGLGSYTYLVKPFLPYMGTIRFIQPAHNIFILILVESGVFSLVFLIYILFNLLISLKNPLLISIFVQIIFLSCFDHYFWTIHQPNLFLWIFMGLCWTSLGNNNYNK